MTTQFDTGATITATFVSKQLPGELTDLKLVQSWNADENSWIPAVCKSDVDSILGTSSRYRSYIDTFTYVDTSTDPETTVITKVRRTYVMHRYTADEFAQMQDLGFIGHTDF